MAAAVTLRVLGFPQSTALEVAIFKATKITLTGEKTQPKQVADTTWLEQARLLVVALSMHWNGTVAPQAVLYMIYLLMNGTANTLLM